MHQEALYCGHCVVAVSHYVSHSIPLVLQDFIISDLKTHYDLAISWLYHEYARDTGGDQYDLCLTSLLQGAKATLEPRDRLVFVSTLLVCSLIFHFLMLGCSPSWFWMLQKSLPMLCKLSNHFVTMKLVHVNCLLLPVNGGCVIMCLCVCAFVYACV